MLRACLQEEGQRAAHDVGLSQEEMARFLLPRLPQVQVSRGRQGVKSI